MRSLLRIKKNCAVAVIAGAAGLSMIGFSSVGHAAEPDDRTKQEQISDVDRIEAMLARQGSVIFSAIANGALDPSELKKLTEADLLTLFRFDLRCELDRMRDKLFEAGLRVELSRPYQQQFDLWIFEGGIEGHNSSLWGSNASEQIYSSHEVAVFKKHSDEFEIMNKKTGYTYTIIFGDSAAIILVYDANQEVVDGNTMPYGAHGGPAGAIATFLLAYGIDIDDDTNEELEEAAKQGGDLGEPTEGETNNDNSGAESEPVDSSLAEDFVEEAGKAWDLFVEMIDDAIDYGPDYVDPQNPIIRYTAGLQILCDLYMEIKLDAIINSDRTPNPMGDVQGKDDWLDALIMIAFFRPPPASDPVDRPMREELELPGGDLTFDGAIDYGEDHFDSIVDPDDIPTGPVGN
jgi:hypothetical protein